MEKITFEKWLSKLNLSDEEKWALAEKLSRKKGRQEIRIKERARTMIEQARKKE